MNEKRDSRAGGLRVTGTGADLGRKLPALTSLAGGQTAQFLGVRGRFPVAYLVVGKQGSGATEARPPSGGQPT